ncbi:heat-shock protein, partial [Amylibacter sp.]|nr:heat-shock protein [Amylibacter sp.]
IGAETRDGLLHIDLLREVPEALKPRKIEISNSATINGKSIKEKLSSKAD